MENSRKVLTDEELMFLYNELDGIHNGIIESVSFNYSQEVLKMCELLLKEWRERLGDQTELEVGVKEEFEKMERIIKPLGAAVKEGRTLSIGAYMRVINMMLRLGVNLKREKVGQILELREESKVGVEDLVEIEDVSSKEVIGLDNRN